MTIDDLTTEHQHKAAESAASINRFRRRAWLIPAGIIVVLIGMYVGASQWMLHRIGAQLAQQHGDQYAILCINMGGGATDKPRLWNMLMLAWQYRFSGQYKPEGSGGFTGKRNYLVILVSNNTVVQAHNWSFRQFGLDDHTSLDRIEQIRVGERDLYRFDPGRRQRRWGCWFAGDRFNDPDIRFYPIMDTDP